MDVDMKKFLAIIIFIILISLFSGCVTTIDEEEIRLYAREFIKDYIKNPETIQFKNETVMPPFNLNCGWHVYGIGTVEYEGSRKIFTYHIYGEAHDGKLNGVLKELKIGDT